MYSRINSAVCSGIKGRTVLVETDISRGLPGINIVGLPSATVMESRERVKSALINSGFDYPRGRITVNLTPASLRKNNSGLDLPTAAGILMCSGELSPGAGSRWGVIGELALDGSILAVDGALPMLIKMKEEGLDGIIAPAGNRQEAVMAGGRIHLASSLRECIEILREKPEPPDLSDDDPSAGEYSVAEDYGDIAGQEHAKRAMVIAASGRHGLLMTGTPGCGKTMLAGRLPGIMPGMNEKEMMETAIIRSVSGCRGDEISLYRSRPFRSPHHSIGRAGLIGGGAYPVPGEITLAHNGVLFLDEICEFDTKTIESLRIPIEEKSITHFRRGEAYTFPCNFQIIMAANPCPCGYLGDRDRECRCSQAEIDRYRRKLSGPLMDRIDMNIAMDKVRYEELTGGESRLDTRTMKEQVDAAVRFARQSGRTNHNSELSGRETARWCRLGSEEEMFMNRAYDRFNMSPRAYIRTLKVARTIADLDLSTAVKTVHLAEALNYRIEYER